MAPVQETLDSNLVKKAVAALKKHHEIESAKDADLLNEGTALWLSVGLEKLPTTVKNVVKPTSIPIKHSFRKDLPLGICLITKDPQSEYKKLMEDFPDISKVIGVSKLKTKHSTYEAKRALCSSYDMFLADKAILPMLPKLLGKTFFDKKKQPIPVDMNVESLKKAVHSFTYMFSNFGSCVSVKVGAMDMSPEELVDNVLVATPEIIKNLPKKWANVLNIHLKTANSVALPIYRANLSEETTEEEEPTVEVVNPKKRKLTQVEKNKEDKEDKKGVKKNEDKKEDKKGDKVDKKKEETAKAEESTVKIVKKQSKVDHSKVENEKVKAPESAKKPAKKATKGVKV